MYAVVFYSQRGMRELVESGRYDTHDDFTVVLQPFFRNVFLPVLEVHCNLTFTTQANLLNYLFLLSLWFLPCSFRMGDLTVPISLQTVFISVRKLTRSWLGLSGITWWAYELNMYKPDNVLLILCVIYASVFSSMLNAFIKFFIYCKWLMLLQQ